MTAAPTGPVAIAGPTCDGADILYEKSNYRLPLRARAAATGSQLQVDRRLRDDLRQPALQRLRAAGGALHLTDLQALSGRERVGRGPFSATTLHRAATFSRAESAEAGASRWTTSRSRRPTAPAASTPSSSAPASNRRRASVVLIQEIFGVNDAMRETARQVADHGFTSLVPRPVLAAAARRQPHRQERGRVEEGVRPDEPLRPGKGHRGPEGHRRRRAHHGGRQRPGRHDGLLPRRPARDDDGASSRMPT